MPHAHDPDGTDAAKTIRRQAEYALTLTEGLKEKGREVLGDDYSNLLLIRDTIKSIVSIVDYNWNDK